MQMTNKEILDGLKEIDEGGFEVSLWEAKFLESILFNWDGNLTEKQKKVAERMISKHLEEE